MDLGASTAIVTGAAGWLGRALLNALTLGLPDTPAMSAPASGLRIRALVLPGQNALPPGSSGTRIEVVEGDLRVPADCARLMANTRGAVVFHAAGMIHPHRVDEFYQVNVEGTKNLLRAAADAGARRAIIVSSNSPCGCNPNRRHRFDESSAYNPYMNYGRSKMLMEMAVHALRKESALESVIVRAPWFYGPFQPARQTLFFQMIRDGKAPIVGDGEGPRSMAYMDNLCQGLLLAAVVPTADRRTYWIADEEPYTMNQVMDTVERLLASEFNTPCAHRRLRLPSLAADIAQMMDATVQSLGGYHQKLHVLSEMNKTIACSIQKAQAELGYRPAIRLEEGMRRSIRWCIENGQL